MRLLLTSCCLLIVAVLGAAEGDGKAIDPKVEARTLYAEAAKNLDIWTMLQLESWGERSGSRLRAAMPGVEVFGEPLFATPSTVEQLFNTPEGPVVTSRDRIYQWTPDGRPRTRSWPIPGGNWGRMDPAAKAFGFIDRRDIRDDNDRINFTLAAITLADGLVRSRLELNASRNEGSHGVAVASDATAVTAEVREGRRSRLLVAMGNQQRIIPDWYDPRAIGRNGAWIIAHHAEALSLITLAGAITKLDHFAGGPGTAAVLVKDVASLVKDDGAFAAMNLPIGIGKDPQLLTLGTWLVVYSGWGATTKPSLDALGNLSGGGKPQPPSCAFYRWRDLLNNPAAPAVSVEPMAPSIAEGHVAALYKWQGATLELLDLSSANPEVKPFVTAPSDIKWVNDQCHITVVTLADDKKWLIDINGSEVLPPTTRQIEVSSRDWAIGRGGTDDRPEFYALRLSPTAELRSSVQLEVEPGYRHIAISVMSNQAIAWRDDERWQRLDPLTGKELAQGDRSTRPNNARAWDPRGEFFARGARILKRSEPLPARTWHAVDVWRSGTTMLILDRDQHVWASTRKPGEWQDLGEVPGASRFVRIGRDQVGVAKERSDRDRDAGRDEVALMEIVANGRLEQPRSGAMSELPTGVWQVRNLRYVPPGKGSLEWNPATGLAPARLRSIDRESMMVALGPVVMVVDAAAGKIMGLPAR